MQETPHAQVLREVQRATRQTARGLRCNEWSMHITPTDTGHQAFRTPPISAGPGAKASPQRARRVALGVGAATQQRPA